MAEEVSAIEKAAEKSTRVEMMKKLLSKVMKNAPKEVKKDLDKHLESLTTMKPKESMEALKTKLIACAQAVKKAKKHEKQEVRCISLCKGQEKVGPREGQRMH